MWIERIHDHHDTMPRLAKYAKDPRFEEYFLALNQVLSSAQLPDFTETQNPEQLPILYIVGLPRSGTTLLSQIVSRFLPLGYINNLIARFWLKPSVGIRLSQAVLGNDARKYITTHSEHGTTIGPYEPHEFGYFWWYWLKLGQAPTHHLSDEMLSTLDANGLKIQLENEILASFNSPVVFKNIICGFHAAFLSRLHPLSIFVYIKRDLYALAVSILNARKERYGSFQAWWSLKPSTYPFEIPPGDFVAEVAMQVKECKREMEQELTKPGVIAIHVTYEELCSNPAQVMDKICTKFYEIGFNIKPLSHEFPKMIPSKGPNLPNEIEKRLQELLDKVESLE